MFKHLDRIATLRLGVIAGGIGLRQNFADIAHRGPDFRHAKAHTQSKYLTFPLEAEAHYLIPYPLHHGDGVRQGGICK